MAEALIPVGLDDVDLAILMLVGRSSSVREMCTYVDRGVASVHARLRRLEELGLVTPPPSKGMHRSRKITGLGQKYLESNLGVEAH